MHLLKVLDASGKAKMKINFKKSEFFRDKVTFLGRVIEGDTKTTKQESVERIKSLEKPHDRHSLRVFLGLTEHFRAFIPRYANITTCLTRLTDKDTPFV